MFKHEVVLQQLWVNNPDIFTPPPTGGRGIVVGSVS